MSRTTSAGSRPRVTLSLLALIVAAALGVLILTASQPAPAHAAGEPRPYDDGLVELRAPSERPFELPVELEVAFFADCSETSGLQPPKCGDPPVRWVGAANPLSFCTFQGNRPGSIDAETFREAVRTAVQAWSEAEAAVGVRYAGDCETGSRWESDNDRNEVGFDDARNLVQGSSAAVTLGAWVNIFPAGFSSVITGREFVETDIVIDNTLDIPEQCFVSTIVHEFGHVLGFGHSDNTGDLMFPSFNPNNLDSCPLAPSAEERTRLQALYGVDRAPTADAGSERSVDPGAAVLLFGGGGALDLRADTWQFGIESPLQGDLDCDCQVTAFDIEPFIVALFEPDVYRKMYPNCDIELADINADGVVNAFDIEPFMLALFDPEAYVAEYPDCNLLLGDVNEDCNVDAFDIEPFLGLLFP